MTDPIIVPGDTSREAERVREANLKFKAMLTEHCPEGVGFIVIAFESPMSLKRPQVALATDHDGATVDRVLSGVLESMRRRSALLV